MDAKRGRFIRMTAPQTRQRMALFAFLIIKTLQIQISIIKSQDKDLGDWSACLLSALVGILMRNLIDNAVRYSPSGGVVRVAVAETAGGAEFSVVDQGPGIAPEQRALVWERFYRVLGSGEAGSGLGLSIVKRIADLHGAKATLGEGDGGKGARVSIVFPG